MSGRALVPLLAGCVVFGSIVVLELGPTDSDAPTVAAEPRAQGAPPRRVQPAPVEELVATAVARPLFSPSRRPAEKAGPTSAGDSELSDIRLAGIVMEPDRRLAIFAVAGAKPVVRSEGESLKEWRLDSISPGEVSLSGPAGSRTLALKIDPNLVRPAPAALPGAAAATGRAGQPAAAQPAAVAQSMPMPGRPPIPMPAAAQPAPAAMLQPRPLPTPPAVRAPNLFPTPLRPPGGTRPQQ
jgi:hypothetical protein